MHFEPLTVYHIYNRGNERQPIFFNRDNYLYFLKKIRQEWLPFGDILAYCLMPNHFHFIVVTNEAACKRIRQQLVQTHLQAFSRTIGKTLSSYTTGVNKQQMRTGNLFQKKTQAKRICLDTIMNLRDPYLLSCIHYVHQNPVAAGLAKTATEWEFSSASDYAGLRNGTLCNQEMLYRITGMKPDEFDYENVNADEVIARMYD